jgi:hypothetical protein
MKKVDPGKMMLARGITPILNVSSMQESFAWFEKLGWTVRWRVRELRIRHPDGHVFRVSHAIEGD